MVSVALCIGTIGTALASPLYPLYQQVWNLLPSHITYLFVAYMFGCLATLLFLGRTSNSIGYLKTLQIGMFLIIVGLIFSSLAPSPIWLGIGRFIIGIASGLISTSATLGLIYTIPESHKQNAAQLCSIITVIGFGLGPFIGGLIGQYSQAPLVTPYLPIIASALICLFCLFLIKSPHFEKQKFSIAPHLETPKKNYKNLFYIAGLTAFCAFASFSLFASLAPSFVKEVIPWHGPLVSGIAISSILLISACVQYFAKNIQPHTSINYGLIILLLSYTTLSLCMIQQWSILFFVSDFLVGIGHGFALMGAFGLIHKMTESHNRAAVVSTYLFIGYWGTILPIIGAGYLSDHFGLTIGVIGFCITVGLLCFGLLFWHRQLKTIY